MSTFGIIYCAYRCDDMVANSLAPWIAARQLGVAGHTFKICAVSVPFEGFDKGSSEVDVTPALLLKAQSEGHIDHVIYGSTPMRETEARGGALKWLVAAGATLSWQADADEIPTLEEIRRTVVFVEARPGVAWFRGSLKNYVFDDKTYLVQPFTPPRIHRVRHSTLRADGFWDDNNVFYVEPDGTTVRDTSLASLTIPKTVQFIRHVSWPQGDRSRRKVKYQEARWPSCAFRWNDAENRLEWNEEHFRRTGQSIPEVATDE